MNQGREVMNFDSHNLITYLYPSLSTEKIST